MIDRGLDGMAFLSGQLGAMLRRRLRELGGIALLEPRHDGGAGARDLVGARSFAQPRHRRAACTICSAAPARLLPI